MINNLGMHYRKRDDKIEVTLPGGKKKLRFDGIAASHTQYGIEIKTSEYGPSFTVDCLGHKRYW